MRLELGLMVFIIRADFTAVDGSACFGVFTLDALFPRKYFVLQRT